MHQIKYQVHGISMRACSISYSLLYGMVPNTQLATDTRSTTTTHHHRLGWTMSNTIQSNLNTSCNVRNMFTQITIVQKVNIADRPWRIYVLSCTSLKWLLRATNQLDQQINLTNESPPRCSSFDGLMPAWLEWSSPAWWQMDDCHFEDPDDRVAIRIWQV